MVSVHTNWCVIFLGGRYVSEKCTGDPAANVVLSRPAVHEVTSDATFQLDRHWVSQCLENYPKCRSRTSLLLPSRLIDVGSDDSSLLKLQVNTSGEKQDYVALRYCWGGPMPSLPHLKRYGNSRLVSHRVSPANNERLSNHDAETGIQIPMDQLPLYCARRRCRQGKGDLKNGYGLQECYSHCCCAEYSIGI